MRELGQAVLSHKGNVDPLLKVRLAVGLLGEKDLGNWWPSVWFTSNAAAFLSPIYGERADIARYHGLVEAARRIHDEAIGVGKAFHLFRLPESLEQSLHHAIVDKGAKGSTEAISDQESAETFLGKIGIIGLPSAGPIRVGSQSELNSHVSLQTVAGHYLRAFEGGYQTFPYFAGQ